MKEITNVKHNFLKKITQQLNFHKLEKYISSSIDGNEKEIEKNFYPISINLDLTTSCNYACDHCVDMEILNNGIKFELDNLKESLSILIEKGLKSVIIIGGGEPTVSPFFQTIVELLKLNDIEIGIVTNGSRPEVIRKALPLLKKKDWVRYSLDSSSNELFHKMHLPKKKTVNLKWICENVKELSKINTDVNFGFSFIIVWNNCQTNDRDINENIHEMVDATKLAKEMGFNYISFKPFLDREENNSEIIGGVKSHEFNAKIKDHIRKNIAESIKYSDDFFRVVQSTNLTVFLENLAEKYQNQPKRCHVNNLRHVLSPLGTFSCPVYRNVSKARIGSKRAYDKNNFLETSKQMINVTNKFDASKICKNVVCLYNEANWFIENKIQNKEKLKQTDISEETLDSFL